MGALGPLTGNLLTLPSIHVSYRVERREWSRLKAKVGRGGGELGWKSGVLMG